MYGLARQQNRETLCGAVAIGAGEEARVPRAEESDEAVDYFNGPSGPSHRRVR